MGGLGVNLDVPNSTSYPDCMVAHESWVHMFGRFQTQLLSRLLDVMKSSRELFGISEEDQFSGGAGSQNST